MSLSRFLAVLGLSALAGLACSQASVAQEWPTKPVKFVSPYPPGGSVDPLARLFAAKVGESLGQQFYVENRTGASGIIGTDYVAKAAPDGYTFLFVFDTHAVHQSLNPSLSFDVRKDFAPVMIVGTAPMAISTGVMKPYKSFADVIAAAKAKPDTVTLGNVGNGSLGHLATIVIAQAAGVKLVPVPYKGGGPLSVDLMGGQVDLGMASTAAHAKHVQAGKLRALVLTGDKRSRTMPEVPTLAEVGVKGVSAHAWWGIVAPAGTPRPIIDKLHAEIRKAIRLPDVNRTLTEAMGMDVVALSPDDTQKWINAELARWGEVVRENGIKVQ